MRELVKLRASILNGCAYCIDMHSKVARKAGESEQRLYAVAAWRDAPFFSERERAALALTDAITLVAETRVPTEVYEQAAVYFESEELAHLIWQIVAINVWNRVAIATRTTVGELPGLSRTPCLLTALKANRGSTSRPSPVRPGCAG